MNIMSFMHDITHFIMEIPSKQLISFDVVTFCSFVRILSLWLIFSQELYISSSWHNFILKLSFRFCFILEPYFFIFFNNQFSFVRLSSLPFCPFPLDQFPLPKISPYPLPQVALLCSHLVLNITLLYHILFAQTIIHLAQITRV